MFEERKAKKNRNKAIKIFNKMFIELGEKNPYGVTQFIPVKTSFNIGDVNEEINDHIKQMAEECGVFLKIDKDYLSGFNTFIITYTLSLEPFIDNIVNLNEYRRTRKPGGKKDV